MTVYVVTAADMGWDCVRGVYLTREAAFRDFFTGKYHMPAYESIPEADLEETMNERLSFIHEKVIELPGATPLEMFKKMFDESFSKVDPEAFVAEMETRGYKFESIKK